MCYRFKMAKDFVTLPIGYKRVDNQPLMSDQVFTELSLAQKFAKAAGQKTTTLWLGGLKLVVDCDKAI